MKSVISALFVLCILSANVSDAQTGSDTVGEGCRRVYDSFLMKNVYLLPDDAPTYPGSGSNFNPSGDLVTKHFQLPDDFEGSVRLILQFVVDIDGTLKEKNVVTRTDGHYKEKEQRDLTPVEIQALLMLDRSPKWIPGKCNGKIVPVKMFLPLTFRRN